ncbi:type II toxin-antitoxin system VapC family toxin [Deinococcus navajonensis]|uniref:Type II toxin-antitoxin system VapC family toxin n=1 Tax=Deinococcus navajonensis TaxID=309884 RepID=A0ABV8XQP9_9DEIO
MTTAVDTNVLSALLRAEPGAAELADQLWNAQRRGPLLIHATVFAELIAAPGERAEGLDAFLGTTGIVVDWATPRSVWELAGLGFGEYAGRRRASGGGLPRRLLADFIIGAHALELGATLYTLDPDPYRLSFPALKLLT